jgi:hypothetical protein
MSFQTEKSWLNENAAWLGVVLAVVTLVIMLFAVSL